MSDLPSDTVDAVFDRVTALLTGLRGPAPQPADLWRMQEAMGMLAPAVPFWAIGLIGRTLANPLATPDALLVLADALAEAARLAPIEGAPAIGRQLRRLADIPRRLAPLLEVPSCR